MNCFTLLFVALFALVAAHNGGGHGGQGGRGGREGPPFLVNVTQEGRIAFFQIVKDQNQTKAQIQTAVESWAITYGVSDQVTAFDTEMKAKESEHRANISTAVGQLSDAITKVNSIEDAQDLNMAQTREQIAAALNAMTPELRELVMAATGPAHGEKGPHGGQIGGMGGKQGGFGGQFGGQQGGRGGQGQARF